MQKIIRAFLLNFSNENKLRAIFYFIFLFILCFIVSIALFDFVGLPDYLENILRQKLQERKISLHFENVKLGLVNGITLENIAFSHIINNQIKIDCKAEKVRISLDFFPEYKIKVSNIEVIDSLIDIFSMDLEPSSGISLKNLNASISLTDKDIEVIHLNGLCSEIPINIKGKVSNYSTLIENTNIKKIGNKAQIANNNSNINNDILLTRYIEIIKKIVNQNKKDSSINITANLDVKGPRLFFINVKLKTSSLKLENLSFEDVNMKNFLILNMEKASPDIQNTIYFSSKKARYLEFLLNNFSCIAKIAKNNNAPELITISVTVNAENSLTIRGDSKVNLQTHVFDAKINADISDFTSFIPKLAPIIDFKKIKMENAEYLNFSADISGNYNNLSTLNFLSTLNAKKIKIHDIMIDEITSELKFKNSTLIIPELKLKNKDMTLNARLTYLINEKIISSELILNGKPPELSLIGELFPSIKENIRDFPKIEFSYQPEDNSIKMQIFIRFMPELFYFVDSNLMLKNLIYDKNHIDKVNASVLISSDKIIAISGGHIEKDGGYCNFELIHNESFFDLSKPLTPSLTNNVDGENSQYISFSAKSNNIPAELLLKLIPYFQLEWLSFYGALNTALDGVIDLEHTINSSIKGKISGENAKIANLSLNDFSANIEFNRHVLSIEQLNAIFYQGVFNGNFHYDFQKDLGDIKVQIKNSNFHQILKDIQNTPSDYIGLLSLKLKSKIYSQNSKLLFNGGGSFLITDCKILNIPILYELIQVIGTKYLDKDWAQIDTINADFKLNDTIIRSDKIETNGNIIALEGSGYYNWYEDYCDFNVRVKPFQELFPMRILSPITNRLFSILELKYSGKKGKRRWTPTSGIFNN